MSKYISPFSVDYRTPVYIDSRDPRASVTKKEKNIARYGRQVVIVDGVPPIVSNEEDTYTATFLAATKNDYGYLDYNSEGSFGIYSSDGITWNEVEILHIASVSPVISDTQYKNWNTGVYGGGKFILLGNGAGGPSNSPYIHLYSYDSIIWNLMTVPYYSYNNEYQSICFGQGKFVAITESTPAIQSMNGITWTLTTMPNLPAKYNTNFIIKYNSIIYKNKKFLVSIFNSSNILSSTDAVTWEMNTLPFPYANSLSANNERYVVVDNYGSNLAAHSTDTISWTLTTCQSGYNPLLAYGNGIFLCISSLYNSYSTDGITWELTTMPASTNNNGTWETIAYASTKGFVALANGGQYSAFTTNGITWTLNAIPVSEDFGFGSWNVLISTG